MKNIPLFWSTEYLRTINFESVLLSLDILDGSVRELDLSNDLLDYSGCEFLLGGQIIDGSFFSNKSGSFGGVYSKNGWKDNDFLEKAISYLQVNFSIENFHIKLPSDHLTQFDNLLQIQALINLGFRIDFVDFNYSIDVKSWTINKMSKGNNKKLRQSSIAGLNFRILDLETLDSVYELLENNRKLKNANLSLTKNELYNLCAQFPNHYSLFGVYNGEILVSAAVVVVTYSSNLYVLYWADDFNFRSYSPVTFLASELVKYASENGYETLDLGTVGQNGTYNSNLARFKQNLGASLSLKYSLSFSSV